MIHKPSVEREYRQISYRLAADVRVPGLGLEGHGRRLEGVCVGDGNVDLEGPSGVWRIRGPRNDALELLERNTVDRRGVDARLLAVGLDVGQFLGNSPVSTRGHCLKMRGERGTR
jgi:hypothetical protein